MTDKPSSSAGTLLDYFERLTSARVQAMKKVAQENHVIEFKMLPVCDFSRQSDKANLASSLSAFANAEGGVIVWGVNATRDKQDSNVDQVIATPGVENPKLVLSRLMDLTAQACSPSLVGVQHRILKGRLNSFVATYVPASDGGPHMAQFGIGKYYVRSGGSTIPMEHFQVADMFGRRAAPRLDVVAIVIGGCDFRVTVQNNGRGAAHAPYLQISISTPFRQSPYVPPTWACTFSGETKLYAADTTTVIHPTMAVAVADFGGPLQPRSDQLEALRECLVSFKAGALGVAPVIGELRVTFI